jgi:hypothetical protein
MLLFAMAMKRISLERAYPSLAFRRRSRNWWAKLTGAPAECVHLDDPQPFMAALLPDTLYVRGKAVLQRQPARPEASLCRECLFSIVEPELKAYHGRVVAFEPDPAVVTQYFFMATNDFEDSGLLPAVAAAIQQRLGRRMNACELCGRQAMWQWIPRNQVASLDDVGHICEATGQNLCAIHGAARFREALESMPEANIFYVNLPYGDAGAYVWI